MVDLGSIGKGYALDAAVEVLLEAGVDCALVHGGTSTVYGLGCPPDQESWKVAVESPPLTTQECNRHLRQWTSLGPGTSPQSR